MNRSPETELDLTGFLPYRLNNLAERISNALSSIYARQFGINIAEWRVLAWLSFRRVLTAKEICGFTNMDKAKVSRAVHRLESRGLIRRAPAEEDQRRHHIRLTPEGIQLLESLIPAARAWDASLVEALTPEEYDQLFHLIDKLERRLTRMGRQPS